MECDNCHINDATFHVVGVDADLKTSEAELCMACAILCGHTDPKFVAENGHSVILKSNCEQLQKILEKAMSEAVKKEQYEEAAEVRDHIAILRGLVVEK